MKLNKRELEIVKCALSDYHSEAATLLNKIENENKNFNWNNEKITVL